MSAELMPYQIPARMPYDGRMDGQCVALCDALNSLPGIRTFESCCGHGERPFMVFFFAASVAVLEPILRALDHEWHVRLSHVDCPYRVVFLLEGPARAKAGDELAEYIHNNTEDPMAKTNSTRHYIVRSKETGAPIALIDAASVAAARSHFVSRTYTVAYAEQDDVMQAIRAGIEPEKAGDTPESP